MLLYVLGTLAMGVAVAYAAFLMFLSLREEAETVMRSIIRDELATSRLRQGGSCDGRRI